MLIIYISYYLNYAKMLKKKKKRELNQNVNIFWWQDYGRLVFLLLDSYIFCVFFKKWICVAFIIGKKQIYFLQWEAGAFQPWQLINEVQHIRKYTEENHSFGTLSSYKNKLFKKINYFLHENQSLK